MEIISYILSFLGGMFFLYLTAYTKAKSKNKALIEDIEKLESEKQRIIAKYQAETEELRKQHTLDIEKRKYQYQDKRTQFSKYFSLLDEFHGKCNSVLCERFLPIISEFFSDCLIDNSESQQQSFLKFTQHTQVLMSELNADYLKLKTETNSIRLIATPKVDLLLDRLEENVKLATDLSTDMLKFMTTPEFWQNQELIAPYNMKLEEYGKNVLESHIKLREQMKVELNEI